MPNKFTEEFDRMRNNLKIGDNSDKLGKSETKLLNDLKLLMTQQGFDPKHAGALDKLRNQCKHGAVRRFFFGNGDQEADGILELAGSSIGKTNKAAALKTLRHTYLLSKYGGHDTWAISLAKSYKKWPTAALNGQSDSAIKTKLKDVNEFHSKGDMKNLQHASRTGLAWSQKATALAAGIGGQGGDTTKAIIKRWFCDEDHQDDADVTTLATTLKDGFGKIANGMNSGRMILTDDPTVRGDNDWEKAEAFAYLGNSDRLNVVYIEKGFFGSNNTLTGLKNWARILIHEMTHIKLSTQDIKVPGDAHPRYSWHPKGIRPRKDSFTTDMAIKNADSWAFFAVDLAGQLTEGERNTALKPNVA